MLARIVDALALNTWIVNWKSGIPAFTDRLELRTAIRPRQVRIFFNTIRPSTIQNLPGDAESYAYVISNNKKSAVDEVD